jgi:F-type H+-transporting ATPase subunit a
MLFLLGAEKTLGEVMKEAVLPEDVNFFGIGVNPSFYSALIVTALLLFIAVILRLFVIPKFKIIPGKFQSIIEWLVTCFSGMAKENSPHRNNFLGAYNLSVGLFIFFGTMIELIGIRAVLVDINGCIALALCSFGAIFFGGFNANGFKGALHSLKDFSLPLSMTFRLFGSMLSGLLVTELVYEFIALSFVVPVFVGIMFTVFHAVIQAYILTYLTSMFYGESTDPSIKNKKNKNKNKIKNSNVEVAV